MELSVTEDVRKLLSLFLLMLLPFLLIIAGAAVGLVNAVYYLLTIFWFGMGVVFYGILTE